MWKMTEESTLSNNIRLCECGCGKTRSKFNSRGKERRFIRGHHTKGNQHFKGRSGAETNNWKGGRYISDGYVFIYSPNHPYKTKDGYVLEHRLIMEQYLGRYLEPYELVHHCDENKQNNKKENLKLTTRKKHMKYHIIDMSDRKCVDCRRGVDEVERNWAEASNNIFRCTKCYEKRRWRRRKIIRSVSLSHGH